MKKFLLLQLSNVWTENKTASTAHDNIDTCDDAEFFTYISKEEEDVCHEATLAAKYEEYNASSANAKDADYNLDKQYK